MNKKFITAILAASMCMASLAGCGSKEEATTKAEKAEAVTTEADTTPVDYDLKKEDTPMIYSSDIELSKDGMVINTLTGEWMDESLANQRPVAIMINNLQPAIPQSGIEKADIIYEMLVEGGITRLMAVYSDFSGLDKIGPVRSARHYYDRKAIEHDAIYVHVGHSIYAEADFKEYANVLDHMDGVNGVGTVMTFRSTDRKAPHNCYVSTDGILKGLEYSNISLEKKRDKEKMFRFYSSEVASIGGTPANKITTAYNSSRKPYFVYDSESGKYLRWQYGEPHIDRETGNQLAFENVIIQFIPCWDHFGNGLLDIDWITYGEGYYASNGEIIPINYHRKSFDGVTHFYTKDGNELQMNPGKTFITVFPDDKKDNIIIE